MPAEGRIVTPDRPCYYGWPCPDCSGTKEDCLRLIAEDQDDDDVDHV